VYAIGEMVVEKINFVFIMAVLLVLIKFVAERKMQKVENHGPDSSLGLD
jgi:large-conductance mechanosensitive channel